MKLMPTVSQGVPSTKAFFPTKAANKPALNGAAAVDPAQAPTGGAAQSLPGQVDLQAFFAAWGTNNEQFDVTKDGTVDGKDLGMLLGAAADPASLPNQQQVIDSWGNPTGGGDINGDGKVDGVDLAMALGNAQPSPEQGLVDGVQKNWGSNNTKFDLNQDGTVDGSDLALALGGAKAVDSKPAMEPTKISGPAAQAAAAITEAVFAMRDDAENGEIETTSLPQASTYLGKVDQNGDGKIAREELQQRLGTELDKVAQSSATDLKDATQRWTSVLLGNGDARMAQAKSAYAKSTSSSGLANRLFDTLASSGFAKSPPRNLDQLVGGITGSRAQRAQLLRDLANKYPSGLGVSAQG